VDRRREVDFFQRAANADAEAGGIRTGGNDGSRSRDGRRGSDHSKHLAHV
jgi:hypothetical protein